MEKFIKIVLYIIIGAALISASMYFYLADFYHKMVAEDGLFENLTALVLLVTSVLFFIRLLREWRNRNRFWIALNILIVIGAFFGFGEEISWGQRIFSIESGEFFVNNNLQSETNLHNLEVGGVNINKLIVSKLIVPLFGFYFMFALFLYKRYSFFQKPVDLFGLPMPTLKHTVLMLLSTGFVLTIPELRIWELWEAIFVSLLLLVFIEPYNEEEKLFRA